MSPAKNKRKSAKNKSKTTPNPNHNQNPNPNPTDIQENLKRFQEAEITFPDLHDGILIALAGTVTPTPYFNDVTDSDDESHSKEYCTNIMGKFLCKNSSCGSKGWGSKIVAIRIRGYRPGNGYNATVFNQRCKYCNELGMIFIDKTSYIERVTYRLKKWARVAVEEPVYGGRKGPPHKSQFCEGCKRGVCREGRDRGNISEVGSVQIGGSEWDV